RDPTTDPHARPRAGGRHHRDEPEPGGEPDRPPGPAAVGAVARRARGPPPRLLPARGRLGGAPAVGRRPARPRPPARRLHAHEGAVPGLGRGARPAAGARLAPAGGWLAGP